MYICGSYELFLFVRKKKILRVSANILFHILSKAYKNLLKYKWFKAVQSNLITITH